MNSRWFECHPLVVFASTTHAALVAGLGFLFFVWLLLRVLDVNTGLWPMIEALPRAIRFLTNSLTWIKYERVRPLCLYNSTMD